VRHEGPYPNIWSQPATAGRNGIGADVDRPVGPAGRGVAHVGIATTLAALGLAGLWPLSANAVAAGLSTDRTATSPCAVVARPSENLAQVVADAADGATICLARGTYPMTQPIEPKARQTLDGNGRATLVGAQALVGFEAAGPNTWDTTFTGALGPPSGQCASGTQGACQMPNAVFSDGRPLNRVMTLKAVDRGDFYSHGHTVYVYGDPRGRKLEVAVASAAITSQANGADPDVTIAGLTVEMFATAAQHGAIDTAAPGWSIQDDRVELNHGAGVTTQGDAVIEDVDASANGEEGIGGTGRHTMVIDNVIADNNWADFDPDWEAGGAKWGAASDLVVQGNVVRGNRGPGLWNDVESTDVTYQDNRVTGNAEAGIFYEISSGGTISGNYVARNGFGMDLWLWGSGILVAESSGVLISHNTVEGNANAIGLIQQDRGDGSNGKPLVLHDIAVEDNTVAVDSGSMGLVQDDGDLAVFSDPTITYSGNSYGRCSGTPFAWDDDFLSASQWRSLGHDTSGVFHCGRAPRNRTPV
jgi:parallel beta-helix repeat protein